MGYDGRFSGVIAIVPPIPVTAIQTSPLPPVGDFLPFEQSDIALIVDEPVPPEATEDGAAVVRRYATGIKAAMTLFSGYQLRNHVQDVVRIWGTGRTFTGHIECVGPEGELRRIEVHDGRAVEVRPRIVWPDGTEEQRR